MLPSAGCNFIQIESNDSKHLGMSLSICIEFDVGVGDWNQQIKKTCLDKSNINLIISFEAILFVH